MSINRLTLWDLQKTNPDLKNSAVCFWNCPNIDKNPNHFSIYKYIEENSVNVKNEFLDWIDQLGFIAFKDKNFLSSIELKKDFSYWWLSEFHEISNFSKSKNFNKLLKIFALEKYILKANINELEVYSHDNDLKIALNEFKNKDLKISIKGTFLNDLFLKLTESLRSYRLRILPIPWLLSFYIKNFKLICMNTSHFFKSKANTTFFSYFNNFDKEKLLNDKFFRSSYWGGLPDHLLQNKFNSNWVHISLSNESKKIKSLGTSPTSLFLELNQNAHNHQNHLFIESLFTLSAAFYALKKFFKIFFISFLAEKRFRSKVRYFPLVKSEYIKSFQSHRTLENILYFYLFESLFLKLSNQKKIVFLHENLPWEKSLSFFAKSIHDSKLLATIHTNVRYWDLRYSFLESKSKNANNTPFVPDIYCCNGKHQRSALAEAKYPIDRLQVIEALRFEFLNTITIKNNKQSNKSKSSKKILIVGCYVKENNDILLNLSHKLFSKFNNKVDIFYKPHPGLSYPHSFNNENIQEVDNISLALEEADLVITGPLTTTSLDAYLLRIKVFVIISHNTLNMSPLRGVDDSVFISNLNEFIESDPDLLFEKIESAQESLSINNFYYFDNRYSRWNKQLGLKYQDV